MRFSGVFILAVSPLFKLLQSFLAWGAHIMELVTGKRPKAKVVDLRGGRR